MECDGVDPPAVCIGLVQEALHRTDWRALHSTISGCADACCTVLVYAALC